MSKTTDDVRLPEVEELEQAMQEITEFKEQNAAVFETYAGLVEWFNKALEAATQRVKGANLKQDVGPFKYLRTQTKYDANALHEELGQEAFREFGGISKQVTELSVDGKRFEAKVAAGLLQPAVVERVRKEVHFFSYPKKITEAP